MRIIYLLSMNLVLILFSGYGQESTVRQRIILGYGIPNYQKTHISNIRSSSGLVELGYKIFLTNNLSIGLLYNMSSLETNDVHSRTLIYNSIYKDYLPLGFNDFTYHYSIKFNTFLAQSDYFWFNKKNISFYSDISVGWVSVCVSTKFTVKSGSADVPEPDGAKSGLAYHITLIGCHFAIEKHFGAYVEFGHGYRGIINGGLTWSFETDNN
jgi:hypothetical protein